MESLRALIRNLAIILLLATFLDLLLPNGQMRGYVKLVMGLFVIAALLSPLSSFLHQPLAMEIPAWTPLGSSAVPVLADSQGLQAGRNAVADQYRQILSRQIRALALAVKGVRDAQVEVSLTEAEGSLTDQPEISQVMIGVVTDTGEVEPVKPITVGESVKERPAAGSAVAAAVQERVTALLEIPAEKVTVIERK